MTNGDLSGDFEAGLLGVEIGRSKIRVALLDGGGQQLLDVAERSIAKAGGPRDPFGEEVSTRAALEAALDRLGYVGGPSIVAAASIGFTNCGVGSGPALRGWLESLSDEIGEPVVLAGDSGVSYAPARCVAFVKRVFEETGVPLARVELAPVASARVLRPLRSGALTLGSGIAWSARLLESQVLEAFEATDDPFDDVLHLIVGGVAEPLDSLHGIYVEQQLCRNRGVSIAALAPAVGVAVSILSSQHTDLLRGEVVHGSRSVAHNDPVSPGSAPQVGGADRRDFGATEIGAVSAQPDDLAELLTDAGPTGVDDWPLAPRDDDTRQLTRRRDAAERSSAGLSAHDRRMDERASIDDVDDDLAGIEAFAHVGEESTSSFNVSDFLLGALGMSAIVLLVLLVLG